MSKIGGTLLALLLLGRPAAAEDHHLHSVTVVADSVCDGTDHYFIFPPVPKGRPGGGGRIGANQWPTGQFFIVGIEMLALTNDLGSYAVLGATAPNGDYVSPRVQGPGREAYMFPAGTAFLFPNDGHAEMHVHTMCGRGRQHLALTTFFFYRD